MLLKEIFSKKKKLFHEILSQKLLNQTTYEKSYIRRASPDSTSVCLLDNSRSFSNIIKRALRRKRKGRIKNFHKPNLKPLKKKEKLGSYKKLLEKERERVRGRKKKVKKPAKFSRNPYDAREAQMKSLSSKGFSSYTTTFLYKNRKINLIRFKQPICSIVPINFVDLFLKGLKTLLTGKIKKNDNTLIILEPKKGGFSCYSSGFRGFLPRIEFRRIVSAWGKDSSAKAKRNKSLMNFKRFICSQRFQWSISPPPRFKFFIKTLVQTYRFRRNKFTLSRKKKTENPTRALLKFVFISQKSSDPRLPKISSRRKWLLMQDKIHLDNWKANSLNITFENFKLRENYRNKR